MNEDYERLVRLMELEHKVKTFCAVAFAILLFSVIAGLAVL